jgi:hypothetical protein
MAGEQRLRSMAGEQRLVREPAWRARTMTGQREPQALRSSAHPMQARRVALPMTAPRSPGALPQPEGRPIQERKGAAVAPATPAWADPMPGWVGSTR